MFTVTAVAMTITVYLCDWRADPGGLSSICPQPPVGPWGPLKPSGRSQVSAQFGKGQGLVGFLGQLAEPEELSLQSHRFNCKHLLSLQTLTPPTPDSCTPEPCNPTPGPSDHPITL
ncbi:Hypothetical predicted protein [Marmota monax]|uniref:Uncharacterized protein n=1 Tax=Marmota monax TaxID=9995 RepID=A0A5E4AG28_MARMO|nr:hypothetical protein GHT09_019554 [Marmota monax]VTJ56307.1 Hypothetical predicted protein [Marmota monax]